MSVSLWTVAVIAALISHTCQCAVIKNSNSDIIDSVTKEVYSNTKLVEVAREPVQVGGVSTTRRSLDSKATSVDVFRTEVWSGRDGSRTRRDIMYTPCAMGFTRWHGMCMRLGFQKPRPRVPRRIIYNE